MELSSIILVSLLIIISLISATILVSYIAFKFNLKKRYIQSQRYID